MSRDEARAREEPDERYHPEAGISGTAIICEQSIKKIIATAWISLLGELLTMFRQSIYFSQCRMNIHRQDIYIETSRVSSTGANAYNYVRRKKNQGESLIIRNEKRAQWMRSRVAALHRRVDSAANRDNRLSFPFPLPKCRRESRGSSLFAALALSKTRRNAAETRRSSSGSGAVEGGGGMG